MKSNTYNYKNGLGAMTRIAFIFLFLFIASCKNYLDIPVPVNSVSGSAAFANDKSVAAVLNNVYGGLVGGQIFDAGSASTLGTNSYTSLFTDEVMPTATIGANFYKNAIGVDLLNVPWQSAYRGLNPVNLTIEAMRPASGSAFLYRNQWLGEALFLRALLHFYLVNLYGDIPLITTSDYTVNNALARTPKADIYKQIIADLLEAQTLLSADYKSVAGLTTADRGRPNKMAVTALLARVYLYAGDWANAEAQATTVINNSTTFQMTPPAQTFLANSKETIWALAPSTPNVVFDYYTYNKNAPAIFTNPAINTYVTLTLRPQVAALFESGDTRFSNWVRTAVTTAVPITTYYLVNKYKSTVNGAEYIMVLRLAEQYLIRAEARAQQNNVGGAQNDINAVRTRAGLGNTTANTSTLLLSAIARERQLEFFTESNHRLFDLRRTGKLDEVMTVAAAQKGGTWATYMQYFPIPSIDISNNPNLKQTPGY